jgi:L-aminopeptidase/D-esterase-like protein
MGNVGAGTGASVASWRGFDKRSKGGLGSAAIRAGEATVGAVAVVNAAGDVFTLEGEPLTGADLIPGPPAWAGGSFENTTLAVLATDAALDRNALGRLCVRGQDAIAACIRPGHTRYDGDAVFAVSCGQESGDPDALGEAAFIVMGRAIEAALRAARPVPGLPALEDGS